MTCAKFSRGEADAAASYALERALKAPHVSAADLVVHISESVSWSARDGEPEKSVSRRGRSMTIRTIASDGRQGIASTNDLSRSSIDETVEWSCANCLGAEPDEHIMLWSGPTDFDESSLDLADASIIKGIPQSTRESTCSEMTKIALAEDPRVMSVRSASWGDSFSSKLFATSQGLRGWTEATSASCGLAVVMSDGSSFEMGSYGDTKVYADDLDPREYALRAVRDTAKILGASPAETGSYTLILPPDTASEMIGMVGCLFCASDVQKGRSMMKGRLGTAVAGSCVTLTDSARVVRGLGSMSCDAEGVPAGATALIKDGVASAYLHNLQTAAKDGTKTTGSAARVGGLIDVSPSNLMLTPGSRSREELIRSAKKGIIIYEMMGLHTVDPVSGEYSLGARGILVENGAEVRPVSGITIAGNLIDFMKSITEIGSDFEMDGSIGCSTIVVEGITVAGA